MREELMIQRYLNDMARGAELIARGMENVPNHSGRARVDLPAGGYVIYDRTTGSITAEFLFGGKRYVMHADGVCK